jgi:hypothetical protein
VPDKAALALTISAFDTQPLPFPDHGHRFKPANHAPSRQVASKAQTGVDQPFDKPMVLFHQIVEVTRLTQGTAWVQKLLCLEVCDGLWIGWRLIRGTDSRLERMHIAE